MSPQRVQSTRELSDNKDTDTLRRKSSNRELRSKSVSPALKRSASMPHSEKIKAIQDKLLNARYNTKVKKSNEYAKLEKLKSTMAKQMESSISYLPFETFLKRPVTPPPPEPLSPSQAENSEIEEPPPSPPSSHVSSYSLILKPSFLEEEPLLTSEKKPSSPLSSSKIVPMKEENGEENEENKSLFIPVEATLNVTRTGQDGGEDKDKSHREGKDKSPALDDKQETAEDVPPQSESQG